MSKILMPVLHNNQVAQLVKDRYELKDLQNISLLLREREVFKFPALDNGLFPAAIVAASTEYTGYSAVWVRDNVYVAYSHYILGEIDIALKAINCLMKYFQKHRIRFENIINFNADAKNVMERPHIRFNGENLDEINQSWEHAQNDALGYFLWFYCKLISDKVVHPTQQDVATLALFPLYFEAVSYWQDEDSGHWEETRKIEASSIGVVVASLKALKQLSMEPSFISHCFQYENRPVTIDLLDNLIHQGIDALNRILPSECIQLGQERRYDSALLFLIYPLQVVDDSMGDQIISDVIDNLQGLYGIPRYLGDSFWCRDYEDIPENIRTSISTEREQWLKDNGRALRSGEEAQWCIFDPIISTIFGVKFQKTRQTEFLEKQTFYFNRSLGQLTSDDFKIGGFKCPELYYLKGTDYVPNDATPLLWTQANLRIALRTMEQSLSMEN
jgi:phosphorylase kinase alpha/beta subunit